MTNQSAIIQFEGKYAFLSNFYPSRIRIENQFKQKLWYPTVEHAYQSAKAKTRSAAEAIRKSGSPAQAKYLGQRIDLRPDWESVKYEVMTRAVYFKFLQHDYLAQKLMETAPADIFEGNTWNDTVWGVCKKNGVWIGNNYLGIILMKVRDRMMEI